MNFSTVFRWGDEETLARKYAQSDWEPKCEKLDAPDRLEEARIPAVHFADGGAQGDPGAVEILYRALRGVKVLYGNYAYGNLNLDAVIRKLPMLKSLDSRYSCDLPYPFGGKPDIPEGWRYLYMGAMNHLYVRQEICDRTKVFIRILLENRGSSRAFEAIAWFCGAE